MKYILFFSLFLFASNAFSGVSDSAKEAWVKTKEVTNNAINASKEVGGKALEASKQAYTSISDSSSEQESPEERFNKIWGEVVEYLDEGLTILHKTKHAPDSAFFKEDKKSLRADFNKILNEVITLLNDPIIQDYINEIDSLHNQINETKSEIIEYREKRVVAPREGMIKTTRSDYDKKIQADRKDIAQLQKEIEEIHLQLVDRFHIIGLDLNFEQVTVLLSRVDSDNIIQMSAVFDVLKMITERLVELTQSSGENIETAKRYYGMQVILIETVIYMQDTYIEKINIDFLPKLAEITAETMNLHSSTMQSIAKTSKINQKKVYKKNLEAQELTIKVARLYMDNLKDQRAKVLVAKRKATGDLELAKNTYDTVVVSAELMNLLNSNQESFNVIMSLQVPEFVPFENIQMKEEFQRLSLKMRGME